MAVEGTPCTGTWWFYTHYMLATPQQSGGFLVCSVWLHDPHWDDMPMYVQRWLCYESISVISIWIIAIWKLSCDLDKHWYVDSHIVKFCCLILKVRYMSLIITHYLLTHVSIVLFHKFSHKLSKMTIYVSQYLIQIQKLKKHSTIAVTLTFDLWR